MISRYKCLEARHVANVCDRWSRRKTDNLQYAFFSGVGSLLHPLPDGNLQAVASRLAQSVFQA